MTSSEPALAAVRYGLLDDVVVVVATLTTSPSAQWRRAFRNVVELAGFGVHPHLIDDVVIAITEDRETPRAHFAIYAAIDMTTDALRSNEQTQATSADQTIQSTHTAEPVVIR
jgi:hypothetical protein